MTIKMSRHFIRDFPAHAARVAALGLIVHARSKRVNDLPVYWLNGEYQLTGYARNKDGRRFTLSDADEHIAKVLDEIEAGRAEIARETIEQRAARILAGLATVEPRYRTFANYRHHSGDGGAILDIGDLHAWVRLYGIGDVAKASVPGHDAEWIKELLRRLAADFAARQAATREAAHA